MPFAVEMITISKREYIQLKWDAEYWKSQYLRAVKRAEDLAKQLAEAKAKIKDLTHRIFGKSSEKKAPRSDARFTGEKRSGKPRGQQPGSKGHGRTPRKELPVKEESVELPEGESCCPECGDPFIEGQGEEEADYIEIKVQAYTRRVKRKRYRRGCKCDKTPSTTTAPMPPRLLSRNLLGVSIWSEILLDKFLYYTPTHRLLQKYGRLGLPISPGTASDGLKRISPMFEPLVKAFYAKQMTESLFFGDETRWSVFEAVEGKNSTL